MGFLYDLFFNSNSGNSKNNQKKSDSWFSNSNNSYDDYYEELHSDALSGDKGARDEMEDEFGDDWEDEY